MAAAVLAPRRAVPGGRGAPPPPPCLPAGPCLAAGGRRPGFRGADWGLASERGDPDSEAGGRAVEAGGGYLDLALADLAIPADLPGQCEQLADQQLVALDQPE